MKYRIMVYELSLAAISAIGASPQEAIAKANKLAALEPSSNQFFNAGMVFDWEPNRLYQVYTKPERITDIAFETGEILLSIGGGDSQRWTISETQSGKESSIKKHIFVKPHQMGISTNLVVTTDKRTYHIELHCLNNVPYQAVVSWKYPASNIILGNGFFGVESKQLTPMSGLGYKQLNFNYHFVAREYPAWMPRRVFDDGHKTYIEFPEGMQNTEAPVIYGISRAKEQEVLNYRRYKNFYIIDHLIEVAELTVGGKTKIIVGIEKERT
jgi:P-type conjugative transfer protein TrbG